MLNLEKYNISVKRTVQMCNEEGEQTDLPYPRWYDDKIETPFVTISSNKSQFIINVPGCTSVHGVYNKFEEILNVILSELYSRKIMIWPFYMSSDIEENRMASALCISFSLNKDYFHEMISKIGNMPKKLDEAYSKLVRIIKERLNIINNIFGEVSVNLSKNGVELYLYDLDFRDKCGVKESYLGFLIAFIFSCFIKEKSRKEVLQYFDVINRANAIFSLDLKEYISKVENDVKSSDTCIEAINHINNKPDFFKNMFGLAKKYSEEGYNSRYTLKDYKLVSEAVVLIKDAILAGIDYSVLNPDKNMVEFYSRDKREIVVEGNKTNRDSYIFPFITDDKFYAKRILRENNLNTPDGILICKDMSNVSIDNIVEFFENKPVVIKPRNTNFGIGITVYPDGTSKEYIKNAIKYAFEFDSNVILEEFAVGMEYRFLIIDGKCRSVAYRRSASVVGDGKSSIKELIILKNKEPWHALTGTPVKMDEPVIEFLRLQNLTLDDIPLKDERIVLRKNSNCCTGGESIVITEEMPQKFKTAAECAAKVFDAKICGIDIIINDLKGDEYNIIEVNDMPGYSINEWPYEGNGEKIGIEILKLLNLIQ